MCTIWTALPYPLYRPKGLCLSRVSIDNFDGWNDTAYQNKLVSAILSIPLCLAESAQCVAHARAFRLNIPWHPSPHRQIVCHRDWDCCRSCNIFADGLPQSVNFTLNYGAPDICSLQSYHLPFRSAHHVPLTFRTCEKCCALCMCGWCKCRWTLCVRAWSNLFSLSYFQYNLLQAWHIYWTARYKFISHDMGSAITYYF